MKWIILVAVALLLFYPPAELTRVILAHLPIEELKANYTVIELGQGITGTVPLETMRTVYAPWNFYVEIGFIWAGYFTALGIVYMVLKRWKIRENIPTDESG